MKELDQSLIMPVEKIGDERVRKVSGRVLTAIGCDASVKALILAAEKGDLSNGLRVGMAFHSEIRDRGGDSQLKTFKPRAFDEPRDEQISDLLTQDYNLIIIPDMDTLGHDDVGKQKPYVLGEQKFTEVIYFRKAKKEVRAFWFMVNNLSKFLDCNDVDYESLGNLSLRVDQEMRKAQSIKFISGSDSVFTFDTRGDCLPMADYNFEQNKLGEGCNMPFGEVLLTPNNKTGNGTLVVDGSFYGDDTVTVRDPFAIHFREGKVIGIEGGSEAELLQNYLQKERKKTEDAIQKSEDITQAYLDNIDRIGEFAVGLNPNADFCDDILIDEKVYGSAHIALGRSYHGDPAFSHVDLVVRAPKIVFTYSGGSEKTVVENGQVLVEE